MTIGNLFRKLLGPKYFKFIGKAYRRIFVDLEKVAQSFPIMPSDSHLLDIGGGDGELINHIKKRFPKIKISMIDISGSIGNSIEEKYSSNVNFFPLTSINEFGSYYNDKIPEINFILISDVIHHVIPIERKMFFSDLVKLINENTILIIKDIEPGYFISELSFLADKYISGDKTVVLTSRKEITSLMKENFPEICIYETNLFKVNHPNFSLVFSMKQITDIYN